MAALATRPVALCARIRSCRVAHWLPCSITLEAAMRVIGLDVHRTFAEVVFLEEGVLQSGGRADLTAERLAAFGRSLRSSDEVVLEATGNTAAIVRALKPFVAKVVIANPLQVRAIAHARVKTDKIDAGILAHLHASGFLPTVWMPDPNTEALRR